MNNLIRQAIYDQGGVVKVARALGVKPQRLNNWVERGVPVEWCQKTSALLGIALQDLRPDDHADIWPDLAAREAA